MIAPKKSDGPSSPSTSSSSVTDQSILLHDAYPTDCSDEKWSSIISEMNQFVDAEYSSSTNDNRRKRELYSHSELYRMAWFESKRVCDYYHAVKEGDEQAKSSVEGKKIAKLASEWEELHKKFDMKAERKSAKKNFGTKLLMVARLIFTVLFWIICMPPLYLLMPIRLLHPILRKLGVHNSHLPLDHVQKFFARGLLHCAGVTVSYEGLDHIVPLDACIGMFTHGSNLDPLVVQAAPFAFKFIGKKILFQLPIIGWLFAGYGHIAIDRQNLQSAKESLEKVAETVHRYNRSIAISPEGTRSKDGRLMDFKKGPFHTAIKVKLPIVPILVEGAYEGWPPQALFSIGGHVHVRFLAPIYPIEGEDYNALLSRTRKLFLRGICSPHSSPINHYHIATRPSFYFFISFYVIAAIAYWLIRTYA